MSVSASLVADKLRAIAHGALFIRLSQNSWKRTYAGDVTYSIDGMEITLFNDCDSLDYVDHVDYENMRTEYEDFKAPDAEYIVDPVCLLSQQDKMLLVQRLKDET